MQTIDNDADEGRKDMDAIWSLGNTLCRDSSEEEIRRHTCALRKRLGPVYDSINPISLTDARPWNLHLYCGYENPTPSEELRYALEVQRRNHQSTHTAAIIHPDVIRRIVANPQELSQELIDLWWSVSIAHNTRFFHQAVLGIPTDADGEYPEKLYTLEFENATLLRKMYNDAVRLPVKAWDYGDSNNQSFQFLLDERATWLRELFDVPYRSVMESCIYRIERGHAGNYNPPSKASVKLLVLVAHISNSTLPNDDVCTQLIAWWDKQSQATIQATFNVLYKIHKSKTRLGFEWFDTNYEHLTSENDLPNFIKTLIDMDMECDICRFLFEGSYAQNITNIEMDYTVV